MTVFASHRRTRAAALLSGVALITGTVAGTAAAAPTITPAEGGHDRTLVVCTAPGGDDAPPPLIRFQRTVPAEPDAQFQPTPPAEPRILVQPTAPGQPPLDDVECARIDPGDAIDRGDVVPAHPAVPGTPALVFPPHTR